jgi:hypothetical protein
MAFVGLVATLTFGVLSVILYFRSKRCKRLTFTFDKTELHTKTHPEIEITFKGKRVENLSRVRAVCWNSGNEEIRWSDIPEDWPPRTVFANSRVLSAATVGGTEATGFAAERSDEHTVNARFVFLNPGDCGLFEVLYEARPNSSPTIDFLARVMGGRRTDSRLFDGPPTTVESISVVVSPVIWLMAAYLAVGPLRRSVTPVPNGFLITIAGVSLCVALLASFGACVLLVRRYMRRFRRSRVPDLGKKFFGT